MYVSYPKPGKHIAFDGRLLHGVLNDLSPSKDARRDFPGQLVEPHAEGCDAIAARCCTVLV